MCNPKQIHGDPPVGVRVRLKVGLAKRDARDSNKSSPMRLWK